MAHTTVRLVPALGTAALLLVASLPAQGAASPTVLRPARQSPAFDPGRLPLDTVEQVQLLRLPDDSAVTRTVALTCRGLQPSMGGAGGRDLATGHVDIGLEQLSLSPQAAPLNTPADEFGLMIHHSGLLAVFERQGHGVFLAERSATTDPWSERGAVTGLPQQPFFDPALADVDGELHILFIRGTGIAMAPLDAATCTAGRARLVVAPARPGSIANSPTPIVDDLGQLIGLSHHDLLGTDNDHYLSLDLDPTTPALLALDTANWVNNGGFVGGRFYSASSTPAGSRAIDYDLAFLPSSQAAPGEDVFLAVHAGAPTVPEPMNPPIILGPDFLPAPVTLPGIGGGLGVLPTGMIVLWGAWDDDRQAYGTWLRMPDSDDLLGQALAMQAMIVRPTQIAFSNSAKLKVEKRNRNVTVSVGGTANVGIGRRGTVVTGIDPRNNPYCTVEFVQGMLPSIKITGNRATPNGQPQKVCVTYSDGQKTYKLQLTITVQ